MQKSQSKMLVVGIKILVLEAKGGFGFASKTKAGV